MVRSELVVRAGSPGGRLGDRDGASGCAPGTHHGKKSRAMACSRSGDRRLRARSPPDGDNGPDFLRRLHPCAFWTAGVIELGVPVAATSGSQIQEVVNRRYQVDAAFLDVRDHSRVGGVEMAEGAVRIAGEYRDGRVLVAFAVF